MQKSVFSKSDCIAMELEQWMLIKVSYLYISLTFFFITITVVCTFIINRYYLFMRLIIQRRVIYQ